METKQEKSIDFIRNDLLPEAVNDRCFCEANSREFVEFVSVDIEPLQLLGSSERTATEYYRARLTVNFSGEPDTFVLIIKLLSLNSDDYDKSYDEFLNEEMFYSKMTKKYKLNIYPRCYVANMGRYGKPVIVLEDLEASGYVRRVDGKLDEHHLELCLKAIVGLHESGLRLKAENFNSFREFYAKLIDARLDTKSTNVFIETSNKIMKILEKLRYEGNEKIHLAKDEALVTMCHGNLVASKCFYFKYENEKPIDVKIIGWKGMRYCSIVVDLAQILKDYLSNDEELEKYLTLYINAANKS